MSPTNHLVNELFHLFRPVVFPAIGVMQDFHFLKSTLAWVSGSKSTFPFFAPEFLNGRGPIGGILWVNHKCRTKGYTAQCLSKTRVVTYEHRETSWKSLESFNPKPSVLEGLTTRSTSWNNRFKLSRSWTNSLTLKRLKGTPHLFNRLAISSCFPPVAAAIALPAISNPFHSKS